MMFQYQEFSMRKKNNFHTLLEENSSCRNGAVCFYVCKGDRNLLRNKKPKPYFILYAVLKKPGRLAAAGVGSVQHHCHPHRRSVRVSQDRQTHFVQGLVQAGEVPIICASQVCAPALPQLLGTD